MFRGGLPNELDHLLVGVAQLDQAIDSFEQRLGVRPELGGRHAYWGTHNALVSLGPRTYMELMGLDPEADSAARDRGESTFGFSTITSPRVIGWCAASSDLESRVRGAAKAGVDLGVPIEGGRDRPDGSRVAWRITPPLLLGDGLVPFFIDWGSTPHPAVSAPTGCRLLRLEGEHPDPERIWRMLAAVGCQLSVSRGPRARFIATLEGPAGSMTLADGAPTS